MITTPGGETFAFLQVTRRDENNFYKNLEFKKPFLTIKQTDLVLSIFDEKMPINLLVKTTIVL